MRKLRQGEEKDLPKVPQPSTHPWRMHQTGRTFVKPVRSFVIQPLRRHRPPLPLKLLSVTGSQVSSSQELPCLLSLPFASPAIHQGSMEEPPWAPFSVRYLSDPAQWRLHGLWSIFPTYFYFTAVTIYICVASDRALLPPVSTQSLAHRWVLM